MKARTLRLCGTLSIGAAIVLASVGISAMAYDAMSAADDILAPLAVICLCLSTASLLTGLACAGIFNPQESSR